MKQITKNKLWESIRGLFYSWGSDTPPEVLWNIPGIIEGINLQFGLDLPTTFDDDDEHGYKYFEKLS